MTLEIKTGSTDKSIKVFIRDSSVTTGAGLTGLAYNSAGLTAYYQINNGTPTSISLATLASATAAHSDGGFIAVDGTNMPGLYRLDLPDAVVATTGDVVIHLKGATNMVPTPKEIQVVANTAADIIALLPTALTAGGNLKVDVLAISGDTTAADNAEAFFDGTGYAGTNNVIPTVTTTTNVTTVNGLAANVITAAATASDFGTEVGTAVWATATRTLSAGTNIVLAKGTGITGFNDLSAAQVNAEVDTALSDVGLTTTITGRIDAAVSTRLASASYTAPDNAGITAINAVTDKLDDTLEDDAGTYRFTTNALEQAPSGGGSLTAADVWAYSTRILTAGTNIALAKGTGVTGFNDLSAAQVNAEVDTALADVGLTTTVTGRIDAAVSSRLSTAGYTAPDNANISAIKAVTDKLDDTLEDDGGTYRFTTNALEQGPSGGGSLTAADVWTYGTRILTAGTNIVLAKGTGITGFNDLSAAEVNAEVDTALSDVGLTTTITGRIDAAVSTRLASASYTAPLDAAGVRSAVGLASADLDTQLAALPTATENADALLNRDMSAVNDTNSRSPLNALRAIRNKISTSAGTLTVTKENDTTTAWTATLTTDGSAEPITGVDPA